MLDHGVYLPPSAYEAWFVSAAHDNTALDPAGLAVEGFADFPPVQFFRQSFVNGWQAVREAIADAQREGAAATA